jgi:S-formylglutathione hydrolase
MERIEHHASFEGWQDVYQHESTVLGCTMRFGIYLPPQAEHQERPVLYWLSGLTCSEQNFITKAAVQRYAAQGAGFYVNATQLPWSDHFQMYSYVVDELPALIEANFPASSKRSISGHSMGGHGALVIALRNPGRYASVSAFSPIVAPTQVPWGQKALAAYLGEHDLDAWKRYDTVELIRTAQERLPLLVDQGLNDEFLESQLRPELLRAACEQAGHPLTLNLRPGHDHSYYFISNYLSGHMAHHAAALNR